MRDRPPLDAARLGELAFGYAARFATTRAKLVRYLAGKLRQRGWAGDMPPPIEALADKLVAIGAVDDRAWAEARAGTLDRRGYGAGRVRAALAAGGVEAAVRTEIAGALDPRAAAEAYARRRRLGRHGDGVADPVRARRDMGAMLRAGHRYEDAKAALGAVADDDGD